MTSSNNQIIKFAAIISLFALFLTGCQQVTEQVKTATNSAPANTTTNSAPTNTATNSAPTNTATNTEVAKTNTAAEDANTNPIAPPKPDNCDGPADDEVIVYEHVFYDNGGGKCVKLKAGEYKTAAEMGFPNDIMSSIKIGAKVKATVCDNENFGAPCEEFEKTDYDLMNNPTIKNDTASSIKVVEVKADANPEAIKTLSDNLLGDWIRDDGNETLKFTGEMLEIKRTKDEKPHSVKPYKIIDGKTVQYVSNRDNPLIGLKSFEDNGNRLIWYRPDNGKTYKYKRMEAKK